MGHDSFPELSKAMITASKDWCSKLSPFHCEGIKGMWGTVGTEGIKATVSEIYLLGEFKLWEANRRRDQKTKEIPMTVREVLDDCDTDMFPTICVLVQILCTIPGSVATAECSFSILRRVKFWVNFSKKRKNRMRNDEAAIIALSKSRSQYLHKDTDSLVDNEAVIKSAKTKTKTGDCGSIVVRLLASSQKETCLDYQWGCPLIFACGNRAGRCCSHPKPDRKLLIYLHDHRRHLPRMVTAMLESHLLYHSTMHVS
ncbi:hypothetical protein PR048_005386 [Dryococelus australis]|uniref:HAT C-terminal dimerisation domain-containing protein n=1 Tax=Dryococelus australis TaxID=614101 RepID=A0ABQ9I839_9NEOP|nr:hypothetical protein PR048_005386 [Dryococelus australis]